MKKVLDSTQTEGDSFKIGGGEISTGCEGLGWGG